MAETGVVTAVYGNESCLEELQARLAQVLDSVGGDWEVVYVVDHSPDQSLALLQRMAAVDTRIRVLELPNNQGQHRALVAGLRASRAERLVLMDADLQDPPEAIPSLLAALEGGIQVVFAGRSGRFQSRGRHRSSRLFRILMEWIAGLPRNAGVFSALRREAALRLVDGPFRNPYLPGLIVQLRLTWTVVPVERLPRPRGRSAFLGTMRLRLALRALFQALSGRMGRLPTGADSMDGQR